MLNLVISQRMHNDAKPLVPREIGDSHSSADEVSILLDVTPCRLVNTDFLRIGAPSSSG